MTDQRLERAMRRARSAEERADARMAAADARVADAAARIADADAQARHAQTGIEAARAHMEAARLLMLAAERRDEHAKRAHEEADERMAEAAALLAKENADSLEYQRALCDYTQLMRHRIANPLQVICGMAKTLVDMPDMDPGRRRQMLWAIHEQAQALERVAVEPRIISDAETGLRPRPFE